MSGQKRQLIGKVMLHGTRKAVGVPMQMNDCHGKCIVCRSDTRHIASNAQLGVSAHVCSDKTECHRGVIKLFAKGQMAVDQARAL